MYLRKCVIYSVSQRMKFLDAYIGFMNCGAGVGLTPRCAGVRRGDSGIWNHCVVSGGVTIGVGCRWKAVWWGDSAAGGAGALLAEDFLFFFALLFMRAPRLLTSLLSCFKSVANLFTRVAVSVDTFFTLMPNCVTDSPILTSSSLSRRSYLCDACVWVCVCAGMWVCGNVSVRLCVCVL